MVSNERCEHNLSHRYKIYALYNSQNFVEAQIVPLPLLKLRKMAFFGQKVSINYYFKSHIDCFYIKHVRYITCNKTRTNNWL